jgi:hypothetical protein
MLPRIYKVTDRWNEPARVRTECGETLPSHADMLRYDIGFHSPADLSLIVLPVFRHPKFGSTPRAITVDRWRSFALKLEEVGTPYDEKFDSQPGVHSWITYRHNAPDYHTLLPQTLEQYLQATKTKIASYR